VTNETVFQRLQPIFQDIFDDQSLVIGPSTNGADIEDWDSLSNINLVSAIEKDFGIRFALGELQQLKNVGEMVELIRQKVGS
jgi:acyl carrier protein